ncbi:RNase P modulator RnpM [Halalkalibacillus halophilus]|uniref:RNase P modulator RnpM n=1 Tax=Halalkalibacillus halophilus TaxID=392827 RepID=UPI0003FC03DE|nr:YlxR family protein [Halalkalibacillus halophilus]
MVAKKKQPLRKCVVTGEMLPKKQLIRIVRNKDGEVFVDDSGKKNGRGAYLNNELDVIKKARKTNALNRHLNTQVPDELYDELESKVGNNDAG